MTTDSIIAISVLVPIFVLAGVALITVFVMWRRSVQQAKQRRLVLDFSVYSDLKRKTLYKIFNMLKILIKTIDLRYKSKGMWKYMYIPFTYLECLVLRVPCPHSVALGSIVMTL